MNERNDSKARLGVFVVSGLVLAIAGLLALGALRIFERTVPLHTYFQETVQGLEPGSAVSYRGVRLGRVSQIRMHQGPTGGATAMDQRVLIEVICELFPEQLTAFGTAAPSEKEVREAIRREVARGLRVRVAWKDITGQKYIDLDYVDPELEENAPPDLGFAPREPYIPTISSRSLTDIQRDLATTLGNLAKIDYAAIGAKLQIVLEQLSQKISEFRADEVSSSFRSAADALRDVAGSEDLRKGLARFDAITLEIETMGRRLNEILAKPEVDHGIADLAQTARRLRETADELAVSLPTAIEHLDATVLDARKAFVDAKIPETTALVREGIVDVSGAARGIGAVREDLHSALRQLTEAGRAIGRLAEYLERNPQALLQGRTR